MYILLNKEGHSHTLGQEDINTNFVFLYVKWKRKNELKKKKKTSSAVSSKQIEWLMAVNAGPSYITLVSQS